MMSTIADRNRIDSGTAAHLKIVFRITDHQCFVPLHTRLLKNLVQHVRIWLGRGFIRAARQLKQPAQACFGKHVFKPATAFAGLQPLADIPCGEGFQAYAALRETAQSVFHPHPDNSGAYWPGHRLNNLITRGRKQYSERFRQTQPNDIARCLFRRQWQLKISCRSTNAGDDASGRVDYGTVPVKNQQLIQAKLLKNHTTVCLSMPQFSCRVGQISNSPTSTCSGCDSAYIIPLAISSSLSMAESLPYMLLLTMPRILS